MQNALELGNVSMAEIDYLNAATGNKIGNISENQALKKFLENKRSNSISSTKSVIGSLLGAAGGSEAIISLKAMFHDILPSMINLKEADVYCDLNCTPNYKILHRTNFVLLNGVGFDGHNASIFLKEID